MPRHYVPASLKFAYEEGKKGILYTKKEIADLATDKAENAEKDLDQVRKEITAQHVVGTISVFTLLAAVAVDVGLLMTGGTHLYTDAFGDVSAEAKGPLALASGVGVVGALGGKYALTGLAALADKISKKNDRGTAILEGGAATFLGAGALYFAGANGNNVGLQFASKAAEQAENKGGGVFGDLFGDKAASTTPQEIPETPQAKFLTSLYGGNDKILGAEGAEVTYNAFSAGYILLSLVMAAAAVVAVKSFYGDRATEMKKWRVALENVTHGRDGDREDEEEHEEGESHTEREQQRAFKLYRGTITELNEEGIFERQNQDSKPVSRTEFYGREEMPSLGDPANDNQEEPTEEPRQAAALVAHVPTRAAAWMPKL